MVEMKETFVVYDVDRHEKIAEFNSQELCIAFLNMMFGCYMIDNFQVQRIREVEGE